MNRYKKAGFTLNTQLRSYSTMEGDQALFENMQKVGFKVAEKLLDQPDGAYAVIYGVVHWVSPIGKELELFSSPNITIDDGDELFDNDTTILTAWELDVSDSSELPVYTKEMLGWLKNPVYCYADQDMFDEAALLSQPEEIAEYTREIIVSIKERQALDGVIDDNQDDQQEVRF